MKRTCWAKCQSVSGCFHALALQMRAGIFKVPLHKSQSVFYCFPWESAFNPGKVIATNIKLDIVGLSQKYFQKCWIQRRKALKVLLIILRLVLCSWTTIYKSRCIILVKKCTIQLLRKLPCLKFNQLSLSSSVRSSESPLEYSIDSFTKATHKVLNLGQTIPETKCQPLSVQVPTMRLL